jgi:tetratricopeptide (TPR) repeat protein
VWIDHGEGTTWKYLDEGTDPGGAWREPSFDDSGWKSGAGPLGHDEEDLGTRVRLGDESKSTTYFRRGFQVPGQAPDGLLLVLIRCDDGAVVYLNGKELARTNMRAGEVTHETMAMVDVEGIFERKYRRFVVEGASLVPGRNLLAAEVHQANAKSDDLFFDLLLKSYAKGEEPGPGKVAAPARDVVLTYRRKHYVGPELTIPDGYRDGGRGMFIDADGSIMTQREVLVVDRAQDAALRKHLEFARSDELKALEPLQRARRIAMYIHEKMSKNRDPFRVMNDVEIFQAEYENREILIGEVDAGVCRHEALLFKLLSDEAGLRAALVRGNYRGPGGSGGHAWNELLLEGGRKLLVDVMNPRPDFRFPETTDRTARRYLSVSDEPLYVGKDESAIQKGAGASKAALRKLARLPWAHVPSDGKESEGDLRRAVESAAAADGAWDRLVALLIRARRFEDLESLAKARLEREDSARARLALAKACEGLERPEDARSHVKEALERHPDDLFANLAAAVLALREGGDREERARSQEPLGKASAALRKGNSREGLIEYYVVVALQLSFSGNVDGALDILENVLALDKGHEEARSLLDALE